jgi:hypothetical protein
MDIDDRVPMITTYDTFVIVPARASAALVPDCKGGSYRPIPGTM